MISVMISAVTKTAAGWRSPPAAPPPNRSPTAAPHPCSHPATVVELRAAPAMPPVHGSQKIHASTAHNTMLPNIGRNMIARMRGSNRLRAAAAQRGDDVLHQMSLQITASAHQDRRQQAVQSHCRGRRTRARLLAELERTPRCRCRVRRRPPRSAHAMIMNAQRIEHVLRPSSAPLTPVMITSTAVSEGMPPDFFRDPHGDRRRHRFGRERQQRGFRRRPATSLSQHRDHGRSEPASSDPPKGSSKARSLSNCAYSGTPAPPSPAPAGNARIARHRNKFWYGVSVSLSAATSMIIASSTGLSNGLKLARRYSQ